jgi:hypothetical protein
MTGNASFGIIESGAEPRIVGGAGGRSHKIDIEQIDRTRHSSAYVSIRNVAWVFLEIPIMKCHLRIDLPQKFLKAVDKLAVPGQKLGPAMHVSRLVDFVLFEPQTNAAGRRVVSLAGVEPTMHLKNCISQHGPFCRVNVRNVSPDCRSHRQSIHLRNDRASVFVRYLQGNACHLRPLKQSDHTILKRCGTVIVRGVETQRKKLRRVWRRTTSTQAKLPLKVILCTRPLVILAIIYLPFESSGIDDNLGNGRVVIAMRGQHLVPAR